MSSVNYRGVVCAVAVVALAAICGCNAPSELTPEQQAAMAKKCTDAGMVPQVWATVVDCRVVEEKKP